MKKMFILAAEVILMMVASAFFITPISASNMKLANNENNIDIKPINFAYPQTVLDNAEVALFKACEENDGIKFVQTVIQMTIAKNKISVENAGEMLTMIDSLAITQPADIKAILYSIQAETYLNLYNANRWGYNRRELPTNSFPENPKQWNRDLYAKKVSELVSKVLCNSDLLQQKRAIDYKELLAQDNDKWEQFYPTLYDVLSYRCIEQLRPFYEDKIIPFVVTNRKQTISEIVLGQIKSINLNLLEIHKSDKNHAALAVAINNWIRMFVDQDKQAEAYLKAFYEMQDSPYSTELLANLAIYANLNQDEKALSYKIYYNLCKQQVEKYPDYFRISLIKNILNEKYGKNVKCFLDDAYLSTESITASVVISNLSEAYIHVFKVSDKYKINTQNRSKYVEYVKSEKICVADELPFCKMVTVDLGKFEYGRYVVEVSNNSLQNPKYFDNNWASIFVVSDVQPFFVAGKYVEKGETFIKNKIYVVNAGTGEPIENAIIKCGGNEQVTNSFGNIEESEHNVGKNFEIRNGNDKRYIDKYYRHHYFYNDDEDVNTKVTTLTDLSLYHPGDTVKFTAIAYRIGKETRELAKDSKFRFILKNPNWEDVDTVLLSTDESGRLVGQFELPKNGLRGQYAIVSKSVVALNEGLGAEEDFDADFDADCSFINVEEYKTPTFYVEINDIKNSYVVGDTLRIGGVVETYSGMPLANAKVEYKIRHLNWWRWWSGSSSEFVGKILADKDGTFEIVLPTDNLKDTKYAVGKYTIEFTATSEAGESQSSPVKMFSIGEDYMLRMDVKDRICVDSAEIEMIVNVENIAGNDTAKELAYRIINIEDTTRQITGKFVSPKLVIAAEMLPSGRYKVEFELSSDSSVKAEHEFVVYRTSDKCPPYKTPLWVPALEYQTEKKAKEVIVSVGSGYEDSKVLCIISNPDGIISENWINIDAKNTSVKVPAPQKYGKIWVEFYTTRDKKTISQEVVVYPAEDKEMLKITAMSFRDKLVPGSTERWTFKFENEGGKSSFLPVMATMSDKALNQIYPFKWDTPLFDHFHWHKPFKFIPIFTKMAVSNFLLMEDYCDVQLNSCPIIYTYGLTMLGNNYYSRYQPVVGWNGDNIPKQEIYACIGTSELTNAVAYGMSSDMMIDESVGMNRMKLSSDMIFQEAEESADMTESNDEVIATVINDKIKFRETEFPSAFFYPTLSTDKNGVVEVVFDVPNFNTTWQFQIVGYTDDLKSAYMMKETVANKPVMVKSNLPRFLRTGDKARICATIFNNSDALKSVGGKIEIFDPLTNDAIKSLSIESEDVVPFGSKQVYIDYDVPSDREFIGFRVYALSDDYTDGEQSLIAIMPSSSPIIESKPFYMSAEENKVQLEISELKNGSVVTLQYSDNPVWYCVTALPSISEAKSSNIFSKLYALFGNAVATEIVNKYPPILKAIEEWRTEKSLASQLSKNGDLKTFELNNTPWTQNANAETVRMNRLADLLDKEKTSQSVKTLISDILRQQDNDGGWCWYPRGSSSKFVTTAVLLNFAMMKDMGALSETEQVNNSIKKAINYCDKIIIEEYYKFKTDLSVNEMLKYLYIRSFYKVAYDDKMESIRKIYINRIKNDWYKFDTYDVATAAILLNREGYAMEARSILESLRQIAIKTPDKGMYYDNLQSGCNGWNRLITTTQVLEAFVEILPDDKSVDGLRQWLLLQREAQDWGTMRYNVEVIYAILSSGTEWIGEYEPAKIIINGEDVQVQDREQYMGSIALAVPKADSEINLIIEKNGVHPAWGGLFQQYITPMADVKAQSIDDLKIEKSIYKIEKTPEGEVLKSKDEYEVGDKVRIQLIVDCKRDMDYIAIADERAACLEPVEQLSGNISQDGLWLYRETRNSETNFFVDNMNKGVHIICYDCYVTQEGEYSIGITTIQSQYAPSLTAHSGGAKLIVENK